MSETTTREPDTDSIFYYAHLMIILVVVYIVINLMFRLINNNNHRRSNKSFSFDYYGKTEKIQVIHDRLSPPQAKLRKQFLIALTLVKAAYWVKSPYIYALYNRLHKFTRAEIGILLVIENFSCLFFGPIIGSLCDLYGRKKFSLMYPILIIAHILMRLTGIRPLAVLAQITAGFASILIDSAFESWLNFEAMLLFPKNSDGDKQKNSYLREVFTKQIYIDCLTSIVLSSIATVLYNNYGLFYPFYLCILLCFLAAVYIFVSWRENKLQLLSQSQKDLAMKEEKSFYQKIKFAFITLQSDKPLLAVGIIESSFKISMALWNFIWTPLLEGTYKTYINPGAIYVCFMLAKLIGSEMFDGVKRILKTNTYTITIVVVFSGLITFFLDYYIEDFEVRLICLTWFDGLTGLMQPLMSSLKSLMIPESQRTTIMTFFKFPINVFSMITLFFSSYLSTGQICLIAGGFMFISSLTTILLYLWYDPPDVDKRRVTTTTRMVKFKDVNNDKYFEESFNFSHSSDKN